MKRFVVTAIVVSCSPQGSRAQQRLNSQNLMRAKPGTADRGSFSVGPASPIDGPVEREWTGGWQVSPFPVCPLGTYATELLSPDGCFPCPRGTYASSDNLGSVEECNLCPPGTFNEIRGAKSEGECSPCPPNTWGAEYGLTSPQCSGRCPLGTYSNEWGNAFLSDCIKCPVGYTGGGGQCLSIRSKRKDLSAQGLSEDARSRSSEYSRLENEYGDEYGEDF